MNLQEKTAKKNYIYRGKILNLRCDDALLPDGKPCKREIVEHGGGAAILCVVDGKVAFVRQYRYAYGEEVLEIPAGKLEAGEEPALAAGRELEEETGLRAKRLEHLFTLYPSPGYTNEKIYVFEAMGVTSGKEHPDDGEFLLVEYYPVEEALDMIERGEIRDAKTVSALLFYANRNK